MKKRLRTADIFHAHFGHGLSVRELSGLTGLCPAGVFKRLKKGGSILPEETLQEVRGNDPVTRENQSLPELKKDPAIPPQGDRPISDTFSQEVEEIQRRKAMIKNISLGPSERPGMTRLQRFLAEHSGSGTGSSLKR